MVIGSGPNGLVAAVYLAGAGLDVTVLEARERPGGGVASSELTLPGYLHDECAGFFPLTLASPAFGELPLGPLELDWVNPPVAMAHPFPDGRAVALHHDLGATMASLDGVAPGAGAGWRSAVGPLLRNRRLVRRVALSRFPPLGAGIGLALRLRREALDLTRLMLASSATFGKEVLGDEDAAAWFCGSAAHSDLSPAAAGGAAFSLFLKFLGHDVGWAFPRGGAGRITDALVARLEVLGGEVRCGAPVEAILVRGGRLAGVRLASGEEVSASAVVAAVSAGPLAAMLPDEALPGRVLRRLRKWRYGLGTFKLDLALDGPVPWVSEEARRAGVVHVGGQLETLFRAAYDAGLGEVPEKPVMVVGQHTLHDPSRAPAGKHTLYVYAHVPQRPGLPDEAVAERMEAHIEEMAPGFRELITGRSLRSPAELERLNPSLVGGDLAGGAFEVDQQFVFRPAPELFRCRTPLRGLYVGSSSVHPGAGVHGASGAGAAEALVADRSPFRFWR